MLKRGWQQESRSEVWRLGRGHITHSAALRGSQVIAKKAQVLAWADAPKEENQSKEARTEERRCFYSCSALRLFSPAVGLIHSILLTTVSSRKTFLIDIVLMMVWFCLLISWFFCFSCQFRKVIRKRKKILKQKQEKQINFILLVATARFKYETLCSSL